MAQKASLRNIMHLVSGKRPLLRDSRRKRGVRMTLNYLTAPEKGLETMAESNKDELGPHL